MTETEIETAYHEAGHAVSGCLLGRAPVSVSIERAGDFAGKTEFDGDVPAHARGHFHDSPPRRAYAEQRIVGELAGSAAHDLLKPGRARDASDEYDLHWARELAIELVNWEDHDVYLAHAAIKAKGLLEANWQWVVTVAEALLERKTLSREEVLALKPNAG